MNSATRVTFLSRCCLKGKVPLSRLAAALKGNLVSRRRFSEEIAVKNQGEFWGMRLGLCKKRKQMGNKR